MNNQAYISGIQNLANYLGLAKRTVENYVYVDKIIPLRKLGRKTMFKISEVDQAVSDIKNA